MGYMVHAWVLKLLPYHGFGAQACTRIVLGPFGIVISGSMYVLCIGTWALRVR